MESGLIITDKQMMAEIKAVELCYNVSMRYMQISLFAYSSFTYLKKLLQILELLLILICISKTYNTVLPSVWVN